MFSSILVEFCRPSLKGHPGATLYVSTACTETTVYIMMISLFKLYINHKPDTLSLVVGAGGGGMGPLVMKKNTKRSRKLTTFMFRLARIHWAPYTLHTQDLPHQCK